MCPIYSPIPSFLFLFLYSYVFNQDSIDISSCVEVKPIPRSLSACSFCCLGFILKTPPYPLSSKTESAPKTNHFCLLSGLSVVLDQVLFEKLHYHCFYKKQNCIEDKLLWLLLSIIFTFLSKLSSDNSINTDFTKNNWRGKQKFQHRVSYSFFSCVGTNR